MAPFIAEVPIRWTDQDQFRHVNHAVAVTLLEEARIQLVWDAASAAGVRGFLDGLLVTALSVDYRRQLDYAARRLRVAMTVDSLRAATFRIRYAMHRGPHATDDVAITAETTLAAFDLAVQRPRRLAEHERQFLGKWT